MSLIYIIDNTVNGKIYIGKTCRTIKQRWKEHVVDSNSCTLNYPLNRAIRKYGKNKFCITVIVDGLTEQEANELERYYIAKLESNSRNIGYNLTNGGEGISRPVPAQTRKKISRTLLGHHVSEETRQRMREARKHSDRSKHANSLREYWKKVKSGKIQRIVSEETREKMAEARRDYYRRKRIKACNQ